MNKGYLITFEGGEGCGKSTQIKLLSQFLKEYNFDYILSREPGGATFGEALRKILLDNKSDIDAKTEFLLMSSGRVDHVEKVVKPALERGQIVVLDRFYDSSYAYQGYAGGLDLKDIKYITDFAAGGCKPDLTFLLDISYEDGFDRKARDENLRNLDRFENKDKEFHDKVRLGYLEMAKKEPERFVVIDATKSPEEINKKIVKEFLKRYVQLGKKNESTEKSVDLYI